MLREIDTDIWVAEQPLKYFGLEVGTRMTVIRLTSGELIVISPIQADDTLIHQINQIGKVNYIIAPNFIIIYLCVNSRLFILKHSFGLQQV